MYDKTESKDVGVIDVAETESRLILGSYSNGIRVSALRAEDLGMDMADALRYQPSQFSARQYFCAIADRLCEEHPSISSDPGIFGGMPHIQNVRLSVGDVLSKLYVYGSIKDVADIYSPDVNEEQIKEAIAYAQDFLETACGPR